MQKVNFQYPCYQCYVCEKTHFSASDSEECCPDVNRSLIDAKIRAFGIGVDTYWECKEKDENFYAFIDKCAPKLCGVSHTLVR